MLYYIPIQEETLDLIERLSGDRPEVTEEERTFLFTVTKYGDTLTAIIKSGGSIVNEVSEITLLACKG